MPTYVETSHGKLRTRALRKDRAPKTQASELAAPYRDPSNGRFGAGNPGGRLRQVAALARVTAASLLKLESPQVAPWLRGHLLDAQQHVQALVDALPAPTDELVALCADEARARLMANACVTEGAKVECSATEARAWRDEARSWLREVRQITLTRKAVAKDTPKQKGDPLAWLDDPPAPKRPERLPKATVHSSSAPSDAPQGQPEPTSEVDL